MQQIIFGGKTGHIPSDTDTTYTSLYGGFDWLTSPDTVYQVVTAPGKISKLLVWTTEAPGVGKSRTFTLYKNGATTSLTVTITGAAANQGEDIVNEVDVAAGDRICLQHVPAGTPTVNVASYAVLFTGSNTGESLVLSTLCHNTLNDTFLGYLHVSSGGTYLAAVGFYEQPVPTPGKFTKLYCHLTSAPDPGGADGYRITLQVNGVDSDDGLGNPLQVDITGDNVSGNDARDITIAAGDLVRVTAEPIGTPAVEPYMPYGFCFVADTDGESIILGGSSDALHDTNTEYQSLANYRVQPFGSEGARAQKIWAMTLKRFYVWIKDAPGAGKSYKFSLRRVGDFTGVEVTIADANQTGNDTTHEAAFSDYDTVDFQVDPDGTPAVAGATCTGIVSYMAPTVPGAPGGNMADSLVKAAVL